MRLGAAALCLLIAASARADDPATKSDQSVPAGGVGLPSSPIKEGDPGSKSNPIMGTPAPEGTVLSAEPIDPSQVGESGMKTVQNAYPGPISLPEKGASKAGGAEVLGTFPSNNAAIGVPVAGMGPAPGAQEQAVQANAAVQSQKTMTRAQSLAAQLKAAMPNSNALSPGANASAGAHAPTPPPAKSPAAPNAQGPSGPSSPPSSPPATKDGLDLVAAAAAPGYADTMKALGLRVGSAPDGRPAVVDAHGREADQATLTALKDRLDAEPKVLMKRPDLFQVIDRGAYQKLKSYLAAPGADKTAQFRDVGLSAGQRDFVWTASCAKVSGDCNPNAAESAYKRNDTVMPETLKNVAAQVNKVSGGGDDGWAAYVRQQKGAFDQDRAKEGRADQFASASERALAIFNEKKNGMLNSLAGMASALSNLGGSSADAKSGAPAAVAAERASGTDPALNLSEPRQVRDLGRPPSGLDKKIAVPEPASSFHGDWTLLLLAAAGTFFFWLVIWRRRRKASVETADAAPLQ